MLTLKAFNLQQGHKVLLQDAQFSLFEKQKVGLIGHNGCGKTSFFKALLDDKTHLNDELQISQSLRMSHLAQEVIELDLKAIDYVLKGDDAYQRVVDDLKIAEQNEDHERIISLHQTFESLDGYRKPALAAAILNGLGFSAQECEKEVKAFSGGWQMRLNLARCLIKPAELLLLDEPTNHLDLEAIAWLEKWLKQTPAAVIVISHDREFLDYFVTHIAQIENQKITTYTGNYSQFETLKALKLAEQEATYQKQQDKIKHLMKFVDRFKAKATKAKQAQSRLKAIDRMDIIAKTSVASPFSFSFKPIKKATAPLLQMKETALGYTNHPPILNQVNFTLNPFDRIGLLGPNGQGKSTFIKTLSGMLSCQKGQVEKSAHTEIGYYAQHQLEALDLNLNPLETILELSPKTREQDIRNFLGGFNFHGDTATTPIQNFSGGEKARLALAKLVWLSPNVLLLDEPTNHLDIEMREALALALETFEGAIVLISHDRFLINTTVSEFYLVHEHKVSPFDGTIEDYQTYIDKLSHAQNQPTLTKETAIDYKTRKTMQNRVKKIENLEQEIKQKIEKLDVQLADGTLYELENQAKLQRLTADKDTLIQSLDELSMEWLDLVEKLGE